MSLSVVHFRMHHGKDSETITFSGNGIKLLDLKKEIVDKKKITGTLDFDLKIVDENNKGELLVPLRAPCPPPADSAAAYEDDDELVPKNASVVVRRIPAKSSKAGLMTRINNRGIAAGGAKADIIMPMKADESAAESKNSMDVEEDVFSRLAEEDQG